LTDHKQVVSDYIDGVLSGEIITGRLVKLAVRRHLDDLERAGERGYYFDEAIAEEACGFFPAVLKHSKDRWARLPFTLSPWQAFIVWVLLGWRRRADDFRRFREAYITVARKNGKTTFCAGLSCLLMYADDPIAEGAEVYVAATKEDQACIMFNEAKSMVEKSPSLSRVSEVVKKNIAFPAYGSFMRPLGSDSKTNAGWNPHAMMIDELCDWQQHHRGLFGALTTAGGARSQPLRVVTCTAGDETSELWDEEDTYAVSVVESVVVGNVIDDRYFAFIARPEEKRPCDNCDGDGCGQCVDGEIPGDDPYDPKSFPKSNPNIGVSVTSENLEAEAIKAKNKPSFKNDYLRYNANIRVTSTYRCIDTTSWGWRAGSVPLSDWTGQTVYAAFDLGWKNDLASFSLVTKFFEGVDENHNDRWRYEVRSWSFICEECKHNLEREPYASFIRDGCLTVTTGNVTDIPGVFKSRLAEAIGEFGVVQLAHDNAGALHLALELNEENGIECFTFAQTHNMYNPAMKLFLDLVESGQFVHGGDRLLEWTARHLVANKNIREQVMPDKQKSKEKIDPMTSTIMAIGGAMTGIEVRPWSREDGVFL